MFGENARIRVECYADQRAEEEPRCFFIGERRIEVGEVIDRWLEPSHRYFKVRGDDGGIYILRYDLELNRWGLTMYDSGRHGTDRLSST